MSTGTPTESRVRPARVTGLSLVAASALWVSAWVSADAAETLHRFRIAADGVPPTAVSSHDPERSRLPAAASRARGSAYGFADFHYARFRTGDTYAFSDPVPEQMYADGFTVVAHIRPRTLQGRQVLMMQKGGEDVPGFSVGIEEGRFFGERTDASGATDRVEADETLATGVWFRLVYRYDPGGTGIHDLWIDEEVVAARPVGSATGSSAGLPPPFIGAIPDVPEGENHSLAADVFAVSLEGYVLSDFFLESPLIRDGSAYFGALEFHDYLAAVGTPADPPLERRIHGTYFSGGDLPRYPELDRRLQGRWMLPFQNEGFVVQGIAADPENRRVFIAMYPRTAENVSYYVPSIVVEVFVPEGRMGNVFLLRREDGSPLYAHVGGIAYWDGLLFVPGPGRGAARDPDLFVYDLKEIPPSGFDPRTFEGFEPRPLTAAVRFRDPMAVLVGDDKFNSLSFMDIHLDARNRVLLSIGNFQSDRPRPVHTFEVAFPEPRRPVLLSPTTVQQTARRAQGVAFFFDADVPAGRARRAFLSTSFGNSDSVIHASTYLGDRREPVATSELMRLPAGLEDLSLAGSTLWTQSESGSLYFQKRTVNPWTDTFPFLLAIDIGDRIDTNNNGIPDEWFAHHGLPASTDPSTDFDGDGFSIAEEFAWDTDPRSPAEYPWADAALSPEAITLNTSLRRFYTLVRLGDEGWMPVPGWTRVRGDGNRMAFPVDPDAQVGFYRVMVEAE